MYSCVVLSDPPLIPSRVLTSCRDAKANNCKLRHRQYYGKLNSEGHQQGIFVAIPLFRGVLQFYCQKHFFLTVRQQARINQPFWTGWINWIWWKEARRDVSDNSLRCLMDGGSNKWIKNSSSYFEKLERVKLQFLFLVATGNGFTTWWRSARGWAWDGRRLAVLISRLISAEFWVPKHLPNVVVLSASQLASCINHI